MNPIEEIASGLATLTIGVVLTAGGSLARLAGCVWFGFRFLLSGLFKLPGWIFWGGK